MNIEPRKLLLKGFGIVILILILLFSYFKYKPIIQGPLVTEISLDTWNTTDKPALEITGSLKNTHILFINNRSITLKENKIFNETVPLSPGKNTISLMVEDLFGKQKYYTYNIYSTYTDTPPSPTLSIARENRGEPEQEITLEILPTESVSENL